MQPDPTAAEPWIRARLAERDIAATAPPEIHRSRFWSYQLTVETTAGRFWFKENCRTQSFEARLLAVLSDRAPDEVLEVTAIEPDRGWILSPDQGETLVWSEPDCWQQLLATYGRLQRRLMAPGAADALLATGIDVLDPARLDDYLLGHVAARAALAPDDPGHLGAAEADRLRGLLPTVRDWAAILLDTGLPLTVEHSDLHAGNAFRPSDVRPLRIFDFGDAVVGFPLCSLLVPLQAMTTWDEGPALGPAEVSRLVDGYLEAFGDLVAATTLRRAIPAALGLAVLHRHESWRRTLVDADPDAYAEWGSAPVRWLALLGTDAGWQAR